MPNSNYDSQELGPELLYEPQEINNSQLLPPPMPELSQIKTGRSPQFAASSTSESGSHRSPVVEVQTTQDLPALPAEQPMEQHEEHRPSQASLLILITKIIYEASHEDMQQVVPASLGTARHM